MCGVNATGVAPTYPEMHLSNREAEPEIILAPKTLASAAAPRLRQQS